MKLKLVKNWVIFLVGVLCYTFALTEWFIVAFGSMTFTWYGLMTNLIMLFTGCMCLEYITNYTNKKSHKTSPLKVSRYEINKTLYK